MLMLRGAAETPPAETFSFVEVLSRNLSTLLKAAGMTVFLSVVSFPLAIAIGIFVAICRMYGPWIIAKPLGFYVEVLRGTPLMLQLFAIFFLLPKIGLALPAIVAAIAGLAINYSAYESEIYRAGLQAVPRGQMEAALALGMDRGLAIRRIILPQAFRIVIPPVTNDFIAPVQRHFGLLGNHDRGANQKLFDPGAEHRGHRAVGDYHIHPLHADELPAIGFRPLERAAVGCGRETSMNRRDAETRRGNSK